MIDRSEFPRGTVIGRRVEGPTHPAKAIISCAAKSGGGIIDMKDFAWIQDHEPDAPWPHPACDQVQ